MYLLTKVDLKKIFLIMILKVNNLTVKFLSNKQENDVVRKISFQLDKNKILGIVGESGSGKSVTALAILGLLSESATLEGEIFFKGKDLINISNKYSKNKRKKNRNDFSRTNEFS